MSAKRSFSASLSTAALTAAVLLATAVPSVACPFADRLNSTDVGPSNPPPSGLTSNSINFNQPDLNKLGIVGAGLAALLGLYAGSTVLKARWAKSQPLASSVAELPVFPIYVPAEALISKVDEAELDQAEESSKR